MKRKVHYRYNASWIDLMKDGIYKKERLKGKTKKFFQRSTRLRIKKEDMKDLQNY